MQQEQKKKKKQINFLLKIEHQKGEDKHISKLNEVVCLFVCVCVEWLVFTIISRSIVFEF